MTTNNLLFVSDANDFPSDEEHEKGLIKTNLLYRVNCISDPLNLYHVMICQAVFLVLI